MIDYRHYFLRCRKPPVTLSAVFERIAVSVGVIPVEDLFRISLLSLKFRVVVNDDILIFYGFDRKIVLCTFALFGVKSILTRKRL